LGLTITRDSYRTLAGRDFALPPFASNVQVAEIMRIYKEALKHLPHHKSYEREAHLDETLTTYHDKSKPPRNILKVKGSRENSSETSRETWQDHPHQKSLPHKQLKHLLYLMIKTQETHKLLQIWDEQMGIRRSHCATMTKSTQSRRMISKNLFEYYGVGQLPLIPLKKRGRRTRRKRGKKIGI